MFWLFIANGLLESAAGFVFLIRPSAVPLFGKGRGELHEPIRWWSTAIIALGLISLLASKAPDTEFTKQALGFGMLWYHFVLTYFCAKNPSADIKSGAVVHLGFTLAFAWWLKGVVF